MFICDENMCWIYLWWTQVCDKHMWGSQEYDKCMCIINTSFCWTNVSNEHMDVMSILMGWTHVWHEHMWRIPVCHEHMWCVYMWWTDVLNIYVMDK